MNTLTFLLVKQMFKPKHISMVNIAADKELLTEFIQSDVTGENLARALSPYLQDEKKRIAASNALIEQTTKMRGASDETASARAAQTVLDILS